MQNSLGDAQEYARSRERYAGVYVDQLRGGLPVFLFTGNADRYRDEIAERLPKGVEFETRTVERTWDELLGTQARISADHDSLGEESIHLARVGINTRRNRVEATLVDPDAKQEAIIHERYGDWVVVEAGRPATADACTSRYHCWPPMGGINIVPTTLVGWVLHGRLLRTPDRHRPARARDGWSLPLGPRCHW